MTFETQILGLTLIICSDGPTFFCDKRRIILDNVHEYVMSTLDYTFLAQQSNQPFFR